MLLHRIWPGCRTGSMNGLTLRDVPQPELPGGKWVRLKTLMGGICGTDLALLAQKQPPDSILQAYSSMPMALGHENVAIVDEIGPDVDSSWLGKRVCVDPTLCCVVRGIEPACANCAAGDYGACEKFGADGEGESALPPGSSIGYNSVTGGSFSEYFVAHESQLLAVPDELLDEIAVLTDPVACSLHASLRANLSGASQVLVYGAGVLGLGLIASLRAIGFTGRIDTIDRASYLEEIAGGMGADNFVRLPAGKKDRFDRIAELTGGTVKTVRFGNCMLSGGYDVVFDCVGSAQSFNESLKWTRSRGQVVLVGTGSGGKLELTPLWFTELTVTGAFGRQIESHDGRRIDTFKLVHEMMVAGKLTVGALLTHTFRIEDYRSAMAVGLNKGPNEAIKVAFDFR